MFDEYLKLPAIAVRQVHGQSKREEEHRACQREQHFGQSVPYLASHDEGPKEQAKESETDANSLAVSVGLRIDGGMPAEGTSGHCRQPSR